MTNPGMDSPQIRLVVIQASPFFNIYCRYCYLPHRSSRSLMEERVLRKIYERLFSSGYLAEVVSLCWHAGEPLTVPIEFYRRATAILTQFNRDRIRVEQYIQTNAMLITQDWCDLFQALGMHVSVSIDGPQWLHDTHRLTRNGHGTFERAMRGVKLLQENGIPFYNIAVLTEDSLDHPDEIWQFFVSEGFEKLAFNLEEIEGSNTRGTIRFPRDIARYQAFFRRLREMRTTCSRSVVVRELDEMDERIRSTCGETLCTLNSPLATMSFDCEGNMSTFSPELLAARPSMYDLRFGNVFTSTVGDVLACTAFQAAHDDIQLGVQRCRDLCPYFSVCGGGAPSNKLAENGTFDSTETTNCRFTIQALCDLVLDDVEESLGITIDHP